MAYAIHRHPHRHFTVREHRHSRADGGWWKFALAAAIMTAVAIVIVSSPVLQRSAPSTETLPTIQFSPSIVKLSPGEIAAEPAPIAVDVASVATAQNQTLSISPVASSPSATSASVASSAPAAVQPQVAANIHNVNFATLSSLQTLSNQLGGTVDASAIKYGDLTGDGSDEAIVPISSDGTMGNLGYVVYTERAGSAVAILTRQASKTARSLVPSFDNGQLSESSAVYGPSDANCCPSQIVRTYFKWDGSNLVQDRSTTLTIPQGKYAD